MTRGLAPLSRLFTGSIEFYHRSVDGRFDVRAGNRNTVSASP
jgi:hypothetical protein